MHLYIIHKYGDTSSGSVHIITIIIIAFIEFSLYMMYNYNENSIIIKLIHYASILCHPIHSQAATFLKNTGA